MLWATKTTETAHMCTMINYPLGYLPDHMHLRSIIYSLFKVDVIVASYIAIIMRKNCCTENVAKIMYMCMHKWICSYSYIIILNHDQ